MTAIALRPPEQVMRLARMGSMHPTRLSFLRVLLRRAQREAWRVERAIWSLDAQGFGHAVYVVRMPTRTYSLVAFSNHLPEAQRTDRVIAEAWDSSYVLYDGVPDAAAIARLQASVPRQEAARYSERELVLARANKSVRLFDTVAQCLARGLQPDPELIENVGYLMRTTAVYGNGKFGIADRAGIASRPEFAAPFQAEMLTVWLIRAFTVDLVEHAARAMAPTASVGLAPALRRRFGVGNATGLGMAPFLVRHPVLLHRWMLARETALARVRGIERSSAASRAAVTTGLERMIGEAAAWHTDDGIQMARIVALRADLAALRVHASTCQADDAHPWDALYRWAEARLGLEAQECLVSLLLEPHGALIDDLADMMSVDETAHSAIDGAMNCGALRALIEADYRWALAIDHDGAAAQARFWYASAEKLEPRLGERFEEAGAEREQPLAFARDVARLHETLSDLAPDTSLAAFLLASPQWRHVARRIQVAHANPYAEIRDNLIGEDLRPVDLLRCKLAMFGAERFDPRSDRWLRITLFQGAPFPHEIDAVKLVA